MIFSESKLNQIENVQLIYQENHCLVTSKAKLLNLQSCLDNLFLELCSKNKYSGMCALTQSKIIEN